MLSLADSPIFSTNKVVKINRLGKNGNLSFQIYKLNSLYLGACQNYDIQLSFSGGVWFFFYLHNQGVLGVC